MANTVLKLGWTNPLNDQFGAHPRLGAVLDLNDGVTFTLATPEGIELPPPRTLVTTGNIRTQGEAATRAIYRHNRRAVARVLVGPMGSYSDLVTNIRALVAWLVAPPNVPFSIQYQPIGASSPVYLDVVGAAHDIPEDEGQWLRLQFEPVELVFLCRPGLRGDRVTLSNLLPNPGFEAPSGPGVLVFADGFTSANAYAVQAGAAPTLNPANTYVDVVFANGAPARYYRLGLADDATHAYDLGGGGYTGTLHGSPTQQTAGGISGDTDTCYSFASASSQYVSCPTTGLPIGNNPFSLHVWYWFSANPTAAATLAGYGGSGAHGSVALWIDTTGKLNGDFNGVGSIVDAAASSLSTWHHAALTWDGTTLTLYRDGASVGTPTTPGAGTIAASPALNWGANFGAGNFYTGRLDEGCFVASGALTSTQIANLYSAGHSGATGTLSNAASLASASRVAFGSPNWASVNTWAVRFRYVTSQVTTFYLHYTDVNNYLACQVASGGLNFFLNHRIGGVSNTLASATVPLQHEGWYWLSVTQFPSVAGDPPYLQAILSYDNASAVGVAVATLAGPAADPVVALTGRPQITVSGAALVFGGLSSGGGNAVSLFGPGGWSFAGNAGTAPCAGAWDAATTYSGGVTTSFAAARIDCGPSGTVDARWRLFAGGAPTGSWAAPLKAAGDALGVVVWTKSAGLGAAAVTKVTVAEYDASGALLRTDAGWTAPSVTGSQASWTQLSGTYTTGASCASVDVALRVVDATSGSVNGTVWFDSAQCWDATATNASSMPYCELRFPQAPAQLLVSGLLGDLPAPALLAFGAYLASWPAGSSLLFALGRRARADTGAQLAGASNGFYGAALSPQSTAALDAASYGGYYVAATVTSGGWNPRAFSPHAGDAPGTYHLWGRFLTKQSAGNLGNVQVRAVTVQQGSPWFGKTDLSDYYAQYYGPFAAPLATTNAWTAVDAGQVTLPPFAQGALNDPAQTYVTPRQQWADATGGGSTCQMGWQMLLPVDGALLLGTLLNPSNGLLAVAASWLWAYADPLGVPDGLPPAWTYSVEAAALPNAARGAGGPGTAASGDISVNPGADPYLTLDPQQRLAGGAAFNQLAALITDGNGAVLPVFAEVSYSPLYLYPR